MPLTRIRKAGLIGAAAAGLTVLAGVGIASASIPDSSGVIHACYQSPPASGGSKLAVIDTDNGGHCSGGHVELSWNQTGPQGPAGATGATGPAGPSTAGPSGLGVGVFTGGGSAFGYGSNLAVCPSDYPYLLSGGVDADGSAVTQDEPAFYNASNGDLVVGYKGNGNSQSPNAWFTQTVGDADNGGIAYAICSQ